MQVIGAQVFTRNACRQWGARIVCMLLMLRELHFTQKGVGYRTCQRAPGGGAVNLKKAVRPEEGG